MICKPLRIQMCPSLHLRPGDATAPGYGTLNEIEGRKLGLWLLRGKARGPSLLLVPLSAGAECVPMPGAPPSGWLPTSFPALTSSHLLLPGATSPEMEIRKILPE